MNVDPKRLEELLDEGRIDEVLELVSIEEAARAWCEYYTRDHWEDEDDPDRWEDEDDPDRWAVDLMMELPDAKWREMLTLVVEYAPNNDVLAVAGAGPLEGFLTTCGPLPDRGYAIAEVPDPDVRKMLEAREARHLEYDYEERLSWIEKQAAASEKFRKALSVVYIRLPAETVARLERAAGCWLGWPPGPT